MRKFLPAVILLVAAYNPTDADRARWTMSDMMSWRTAVEAYAVDNHAYPDVKTIEALRDAVQPRYIIHAPMVDAWGNPYRYERNGSGFRLVSAGADGNFDSTTWASGSRQLPFDADAVVSNEGRWMFRSWEFK
jgi:hypothetical protein